MRRKMGDDPWCQTPFATEIPQKGARDSRHVSRAGAGNAGGISLASLLSTGLPAPPFKLLCREIALPKPATNRRVASLSSALAKALSLAWTIRISDWVHSPRPYRHQTQPHGGHWQFSGSGQISHISFMSRPHPHRRHPLDRGLTRHSNPHLCRPERSAL